MTTIGSLCSGIGGLDLGLERAIGSRTLWQVEVSAFCRGILARHWPNATRYEDIHKVGPELAPVDWVCAGFPCQPASTAGLRKGVEDDRWLWPEVARVVRVVRPRRVLLENVRGLLSLDGGRPWGTCLADLDELGYHCVWGVFHASDVGSPHGRPRLFCLAYVADADARRWEERPAIERDVSVPGEGGVRRVAVADAHGPRQRQPSGDQPEGGGRHRHGGEGGRPGAGTGGVPEPGLGGDPHGIPTWVDRMPWPAPRGAPQHAWEPPRLVTDPGVLRTARLKALGNAVVPAVACLAARALLARAGLESELAP